MCRMYDARTFICLDTCSSTPHSITPSLHHSFTPTLNTPASHHSTTPTSLYSINPSITYIFSNTPISSQLSQHYNAPFLHLPTLHSSNITSLLHLYTPSLPTLPTLPTPPATQHSQHFITLTLHHPSTPTLQHSQHSHLPQHSITPSLHLPNTFTLQHSNTHNAHNIYISNHNTPSLQHSYTPPPHTPITPNTPNTLITLFIFSHTHTRTFVVALFTFYSGIITHPPVSFNRAFFLLSCQSL